MIKAIIWDLYGVVYKNGQIDPKAKDIVEQLKAKGIINATISNLSPNTVKEIGNQLGLDPIIACAESGQSKTDANTYQKFINDLNIKPEECLMIDDLISNLLPAKQVGIKTVLFSKNNETDEVDFALDDIEKIVKLIKSL